jgi:hypothetical protein
MRRTARIGLFLVTTATALGVAAPAWACAGLIGPNGSVQLLRTSTLAAHADGVEHYVTSFEFSGGGAEVGSIVPLPGVPTRVERGGDWTLQRLDREVAPPAEAEAAAGAVVALDATDRAEELLNTRIDALDITVLRGGGRAVGDWAREHGFSLTPDAPEVLDFYAERSQVFMAARFDATAARAAGQGVGDGTPIHLTIPLEEPWVPLRILGLGRGAEELVEADVFLLTERQPSLSAGGPGLSLDRSEAASDVLLDDLRSDKGMGWIPDEMWFSHLRLGAEASALDYDLGITTAASTPSPTAVGVAAEDTVAVGRGSGVPVVPLTLLAATAGVVLVLVGRRARRPPVAP